MIDYLFDTIIDNATRDNLSRMTSLNDSFNKYIKRSLLSDNTTILSIICNSDPPFVEERRILQYLKESDCIYIKRELLPSGYQAGRLSEEMLKNMNALSRIKITLQVLNILANLEKERIYPGALNLYSIVYDTSFVNPKIMLGGVLNYQIGCLRQLFSVAGYDLESGLPLYFDSNMQHIANIRLALSILTPCGDSLEGIKQNDPLTMYLKRCNDCTPSELSQAILSYLDVSWLGKELTEENREKLYSIIREKYPDVTFITSEEAERYKEQMDDKIPTDAYPSPAADILSEFEQEPATDKEEADMSLASAINKVRQFVGFQKNSKEMEEDYEVEKVKAPEPQPSDLVSGKIGMCFIIPPFTQTTETDKFREQISLVQSSASAALGSKTKDLQIAYFWANSPEDAHTLYNKSSHTDFMPYDISYFPPILPGKSKNASYIRSAFVSSENLVQQSNFSRTLNVVLLPGVDTSDASWVVDRAKKEVNEKYRVLFVHAARSWKTGINSDDPACLDTLSDEIRKAYSH